MSLYPSHPAAAAAAAHMAAAEHISRYETTKRFSEIVIHSGVVYLAGQVPEDHSVAGGIVEQTRSVLHQIEGFLERAGSSRARILTMTIYLTDMRYLGEMNAEFEAWMPEGHAPARATVAVTALADPRACWGGGGGGGFGARFRPAREARRSHTRTRTPPRAPPRLVGRNSVPSRAGRGQRRLWRRGRAARGKEGVRAQASGR
jgi:enamine deaminase RidA (YjgF/YER057c/UK114 family)